MVNVPLPEGYLGIDELPKQRENLINMVNIDGSVVRTPGIESFRTQVGDGCRGAATWFVDGKPYFVIGNDLIRIESNQTITTIGTIDGTADCILSGGQVQMVICVKGAKSYTYSDSGGLAQIVDPNFLPSKSVDFIDGRHVFVPSDGSPAIYSEVDQAGTFNALSFFDAEELPDINQHLINVRNQLYIQGNESSEIFSTTGNVDAPFARRSGSRIDYGYISGGIRYKNTFAFIGKQRDQSYAFYLMGTGDAVEFSRGVVAQDLNERYTKEEIASVKANKFKWFGQEFLAFTFPDKTYAFSEGKWFFLDSDLNGTEDGPWRVNGVAYAYGNYYVGDLDSGNIGLLTEDPGEYGLQVEYQIDTFMRSPRGAYMTPKMLELEILSGQNGTTVGVALSRDGRVRGDYHYRSLGATGEYQKRVRWRPSGGLGRFESFVGISIRGTGNVRIGSEGIYVD